MATETFILEWVRGGRSLYEMDPEAAVHIQRFVIRDGEPFDEAAYRRLHCREVKRKAAQGSPWAADVLRRMRTAG